MAITFPSGLQNNFATTADTTTADTVAAKEPEIVNKPKPKRLRRLLTIGALIITGTVIFSILDNKKVENLAKEHEIKDLLSITCKNGGPKNLPVAEHFTDEKDSQKDKPRIVILGSGWGAISVLKELEKDNYHVTLISPQPLLPSATVGTLETRSLLEPIRSIVKGIDAHYLEATATDICFDERLVEVKPTGDFSQSFYVPYDKLIIAVGSQSITHGIEGIEHCHFLKTVNDARKLRKTIIRNFEMASLPTTSPEEKKRLLSFVVCGGGPTGVEFAAELHDFLNEDLVRYFPAVLRNEVKVSIIQSQDHILNTYDEKISKFAESKFQRDNINVITNARVQKIEPNQIVYKMKKGDKEERLDYGLCLWSTGIYNRLRLKGAPDSSVYAIGDCSTIENPKLVQNLMQFFIDADTDKNNCLSYNEFHELAKKISRRYPITSNHLKKADSLFARYDIDKSGTLELDELQAMLNDIDKQLTALPAVSQVAHQQGKYLGKKLNSLALASKTNVLPTPLDYSTDTDNPAPDTDDRLAPFNYAHLGSLAYIGNAAVADFGMGWTWMGNWSAVYLWRSIYLSEQVSFRTRTLLAIDWSKCDYIRNTRLSASWKKANIAVSGKQDVLLQYWLDLHACAASYTFGMELAEGYLLQRIIII
ncbi:365_t:CDS:10 [Entrophospora sp. SA101]|nr:365_t:CDS:10 [Entrophospora sp. SA101]